MKPIAGYLKKLNKIDKLVARLKKKKRERERRYQLQISRMKDPKGLQILKR